MVLRYFLLNVFFGVLLICAGSLQAQEDLSKDSNEAEMLQDMEQDMEQDLSQKSEAEAKARAKRERLKLPPNSPGSQAPEVPPIAEVMEDLHTELSDDVTAIADNIDSFFVNRQIVEGRNRTNARISNSASFIDESGYVNDFDFKFRLQLPQLKRKIQIEFEDDYLDNSSSDTTQSRATQIYSPRRDSSSRGALSYYESFAGLQSKLSTGLEYKDEVILFGRFRLSRDFVLTRNQKITLIHDYFDDTIARRGQLGILNYDYSFTSEVFVRFFNEELYRDENNIFETAHGISLFHQIDDKNVISYNYRVNSLNPGGEDTFYLNTHIVSVVWRHKLYRTHLYGEISPSVFFPKEKQFEGLAGITFKLDLIFGNI